MKKSSCIIHSLIVFWFLFLTVYVLFCEVASKGLGRNFDGVFIVRISMAKNNMLLTELLRQFCRAQKCLSTDKKWSRIFFNSAEIGLFMTANRGVSRWLDRRRRLKNSKIKNSFQNKKIPVYFNIWVLICSKTIENNCHIPEL